VELDVPPGDDAAAFLVPEGSRLVVSTDASVEGIHFRREWLTWEIVGYRAAAAALSDLAAMAAEPIGLTLSVALPPELDANAASSIGRGVGEALRYTGGEILGGDLVASPGPVVLDVTVLGHTPRPVTRSGADVGEEVWITGSLGGSAAAVADLQAGLEPTPEARAAFERPRPRVAEALWLAEHVHPTAQIDVSDGLGRDGRHLAMSSSVRLDVALEDVPAHPSLESYLESEAGVRLLLAGGEDYELLFTAPVGRVEPLQAEFATRFGIDLTRIGSTSEGSGLRVSRAVEEGAEPDVDGYDHFRDAGA
jgi:thiamine-monophosphate kinase